MSSAAAASSRVRITSAAVALPIVASRKTAARFARMSVFTRAGYGVELASTSNGRPSISSGRLMPSSFRTVGATSTIWTNPSRRVVPVSRNPGAMPGPRSAATVTSRRRELWYGPTTSTASWAGSTCRSSRPTSLSVERRAARRIAAR